MLVEVVALFSDVIPEAAVVAACHIVDLHQFTEALCLVQAVID